MVKGSVDIANHFNEHFVSIGIKTANSVQPSETDFRKFIRRNPDSFALFPLGPSQIVEIVDKLHDKNTQDINDISVSFLKKNYLLYSRASISCL